jgi:predicted NUDIX family NTP pyrophosphohydrolase
VGRLSSGLLLYRRSAGALEVLLVHMGGPFWRKRDAGAWSIPKGEHQASEDSLREARREFAEELGVPAPSGTAFDLGAVKQAGGKVVRTWAQEADLEVGEIASNTFELEWPRGSGRLQRFPEVDRAAWLGLDVAREKLVAGQRPFLDRLREQAPWRARAGADVE